MKWRITNDDVMGGRSESRAESANGALHFKGELSLENNGGFASVLSGLDTPLRRFHGVRLTVSGDGRRYQFRLRESTERRGVAWRAHFDAGPKPRRITLLPDDFEPVVRGEVVIGARPLAETPVRHLGFLLSRDTAGPFRLEVRDIEFLHYSGNSGARLVIGARGGIGRALLEQQLSDPDVGRVIGTYRPDTGIAELEALNDRWGDRLVLHPLDVTNPDSLESFGSFLDAREDGVDLAIHAAGLLHRDGVAPEKSVDQCSAPALEKLFRVNAIGPLMTARTLIGIQPRQRRFTFVALSAMVGSIGENRLGGWYGYRASKTALNQFMHTLAIECRHRFPHATIVAVHPGTTDTGLSRPFIRRVEPEKLYTAKQTAGRILQLAAGLSPADSGRFFNWNGTEIAW